jgi:putative transferase (TIGR04331 family)
LFQNAKEYEQLKSFSEFEKEKYLLYLPIIKQRLNHIHKVNESESFWERVLGLTFLIHIAQCVLAFNYIKKKDLYNYVDKNQQIEVPWDEDGYRNTFVNSDIGRNLFYQFLYNPNYQIRYSKISNKPQVTKSANQSFRKRIGTFSLFELIREIIIITLQKIKSPKAIIFETYWDKQNIQKILFNSMFDIQYKSFNFDDEEIEAEVDLKKRSIIASTSAFTDEFDKFFFKSLKYCMPTSIIERFHSRLMNANLVLNNYKKLKFIFNESMSPNALLLIAQAKKNKIVCYYVEHNYLQQQFLGNNIWYIKRKYDYFLSLGWKIKKDSKHIASSSNFKWSIKEKKNKSIDILYISGIATKNFPHFSSGYGESGDYRAKSYIDMKRMFIDSIERHILEKCYYKDYPKIRRKMLSEHKLNVEFRRRIKDKVFRYDDEDKLSTLDLISKSKLVICDYLSTPYNQSLLSNLPTIILFNKETYLLTDEFQNFYDELIDAKILYTNPIEAAKFLNENINNVSDWWNLENVQNARKKYLSSNFGEKNKINRYILDTIR